MSWTEAVRVIALEKGVWFEQRARYYPSEKKFRVYKRVLKLFPRLTGEIYKGEAECIVRKGKRGMIFADVNGREALNVRKILAGELNASLKVELEHLTEDAIYKSAGSRSIPLMMAVAFILAGVGIAFIINMALGVAGVNLGG